MAIPNYLLGLNRVHGQNTVVDVWRDISTQARLWAGIHHLPSRAKKAVELDDLSFEQIKSLNKINEKVWIGFCEAIGMTVYGAVALSWCEGAEIEQVWEGWEQSGFPLIPKPEYERPARFINPALLPETVSLSELASIAGNKSLPLCAMIVALQDKPLEFDLPADQLKSAKPQIAAFLKSRMERKDNRTDEENALIVHWSETIKGKEFDVWSTT